MEVQYNILNFENEEGCRLITSPRSVEACLRSGLDPSDLLPQSRKAFDKPGLTEKMIDIAYSTYESKRRERIEQVAKNRNAMLSVDEINRPDSPGAAHAARMAEEAAARANAAMEKELKRVEALKRRQESEIAKMIEKETASLELQKKIARGEQEQVERAKEHEKKVLAAKAAAQKKIVQRLQERAQADAAEVQKKKEMMRKEKEVEVKLAKIKAAEDERIAAEAAIRDAAAAAKVAAKKKKTEEAIAAQFKLAEDTRINMEEREVRVKAQIEEKKEIKRIEVAESRAAAAVRIGIAKEKFHGIHEKKKQDFYLRQTAAAERAKEKAVEDQEILKKQADARERKINMRQKRLEDAYRTRYNHRMDIVSKRREKDKTYGIISKQRNEENALKKFQSDLRLSEKREEVERIARVNEYRRLQIQKKIDAEDRKFLKIRAEKQLLLDEHRDDVKAALTRKHQISDAMDQMRMTNDFSKLDQLFAAQASEDKGDDHDHDDDHPGTAPGTATGAKK